MGLWGSRHLSRCQRRLVRVPVWLCRLALCVAVLPRLIPCSCVLASACATPQAGLVWLQLWQVRSRTGCPCGLLSFWPPRLLRFRV